MPLQLWLQ